METRTNIYIHCVILMGAMFMVAAKHSYNHTLDGYIIHVSHKCGKTQADPTNLTVTTDIKDLRTSAECRNSSDVNRPFIRLPDGVHHFKQILVHGTGAATDCIFHKKKNAEVYTVVIEIAYGDTGGYVNLQGDNYLVTCTYDENGLEIYQSFPNITNNTLVIQESYIAPIEIIEKIGVESSGTFTIDVINILGNTIEGAMPLGSKVRLRGTLVNATNAVGIRPISCIATGGPNSYQILRGGCGDGVVFPLNQGFTSTGLVSTSPYFNAFSLRGYSTILFSCNITVCSANCDGKSCTTARRRKRDLSHAMQGLEDIMPATVEDMGIMPATSEYISILPPVNEEWKENTRELDGLVLLSKEQTPHKPVTSSIKDGVLLVMLICAILPFVVLAIGIVCLYKKFARHHEVNVARIEIIQPPYPFVR